MTDFFDNSSVAAFLGAAFAFLLVAATDLRRSRRQVKALTGLLEDNRNLAAKKLHSVRVNIALLKEGNKILGAPFCRSHATAFVNRNGKWLIC